MVWDWLVGGVTDEVPRTIGPECENYMTNRRRIIESILFCILFICLMRWAIKRMEPIHVPCQAKDMDQRYSPLRIALLLIMTLIFGIEMGFKLANRSVIFVLNPCHIQTIVQIYLLAAKPNKVTITMFRIQMNNLNGPFLAFLFPEVECRTLPFEQATYWIQHAMLYIIPVYILRSGAYQAEDLYDLNWSIVGVEFQLIYHFTILNYGSMYTGVNLNHMLCAAESDPFQGQNYRIAAVIHESILCPILNKLTVYMFGTPQSIQYSTKRRTNSAFIKTGATTRTALPQEKQYEKLTFSATSAAAAGTTSSSSRTTTLMSQQQQEQQQHKPPNISNKMYLHGDAPSSSSSSGGSTSQLIHRNIVIPGSGVTNTSSTIRDYHQKTHPLQQQQHHQQQRHQQQQHHQQQSHHQQQQPHHQQHQHEHHVLQDEAVYEADYRLERSDDLAVVKGTKLPQPPPQPPATITAEYRMPTTKID